MSFCVCDRGVDIRYPYLARHRCRYSIVAGPGYGTGVRKQMFLEVLNMRVVNGISHSQNFRVPGKGPYYFLVERIY